MRISRLACALLFASVQNPDAATAQVAKLMAPGVVSTDEIEYGASFGLTHDTVFFTRRRSFSHPPRIVAAVRDIGGKWRELGPLPFGSTDGDEYPSLSRDGRRLYFASRRPIPGTREASRFNTLWVSERNGDGWSDAKPLRLAAEDQGMASHPFEATDGALYFHRRTTGSSGVDIYAADRLGPAFGVARAVPVNSNATDGEAVLWPGRDRMVFYSDRPGGFGSGDLWVAERTTDGWAAPRNVGADVNTADVEWTPSLSRDGRVLLFARASVEMNRSDIYVADVSSIPRLGPASLEVRGGRWWNGTGFVAQTRYIEAGLLSSQRPARVDSVLELAGKFVIPPLTEAHTHTLAYVPTRAPHFVQSGILYAVIMNVDRTFIQRHLGRFNHPSSVDVNYASAAVTERGAHPVQIGMQNGRTIEALDGDWVTLAESEVDIAQKADEMLAANPDFIKLFLVGSSDYASRRRDTAVPARYRGMNPQLVADVTRRAHAAGRRVAAHVESADDFSVAVRAGVDIIAHLPGFAMGPYTVSDLASPARLAESANPDRFRIRAEDARIAAAAGVTVITTLGGAGQVPDGVDAVQASQLRSALAVRRELVAWNLRVLREAGVALAIGSDAGERDVVSEALGVAEFGVLGNAEILDALTRVGARVAFPRRRVGRLDDGFDASFVVLGADPVGDLANLRQVNLVVKNGHVVWR